MKYLFGSKMLKMSNPRDEDMLTFVNSRGSEITEQGHRSISLFRNVITYFIQGTNVKSDDYTALHLYQLSAPFHDDVDYPFNDFNITEHKEVWIKYLKAYMNDEAVEQKAIAKEILPKTFYHILYQYNMILEGTVWISDAARVNVQKIHDLEMPSSYFYELRDLINSL